MKDWLHSIWFLARKDVQYSLRQRETRLWTFIMPGLFIYFFGTVTGGGGGGPGIEPVPLAMEAPASAGFLAKEISGRLEEQGFLLSAPNDSKELQNPKRSLRLPERFTEKALAGEVVEVLFKRRGAGLATDYEKFRVYRAVYTVLADFIICQIREGGASPEAFRRLKEAPRALRLEVRSAGRRKKIPQGFEQTVPGTMVMFTMLILLTGGVIPLVSERKLGLLRRLASTPIPRNAVVLGKWLGKMALAIVQLLFAAFLGTLVFGMDWGPSIPALVALLVLWAAFNASLAMVLANWAATEAQATGIGLMVTMSLAALGGCWWPVEVTSGGMQLVAKFLPSGWTMEAMHRLVSFQTGVETVLPHFAALALAALILGLIAVRTFRYD